MIIDFAEEVFAVFDGCDASSLYEAAKYFAKFHENYLNGSLVNIDKTSHTMMEKMFAKTQFTPDEQIDDMRKKREDAIVHFCYIYGGYIAWKLKCDWDKKGFLDIVEKSEYISLAAEQVVASLIRKLIKDGYREGKFSHLVNKAIKRKSMDVADKYSTWKKHNHNISFEKAEEILGGVIELIDDNESDSSCDSDVAEKELETAGMLQILKKVKTKNSADDYNMFILYCFKKQKLGDIAKQFNLSIATVSRRINDFTEAGKKLYRQYKNDMERY